jgi:hypothetical protein
LFITNWRGVERAEELQASQRNSSITIIFLIFNLILINSPAPWHSAYCVRKRAGKPMAEAL